MATDKPLPELNVWNRPFWDAAREHRLLVQRCQACGHAFYPPGPVCNRCQSQDLRWVPASGRGRVVSWVVFHQRYFAGFKDDIPYNVVMVELEEGPILLGNVVGLPNSAIAVGLPVEAVFDDVTPEVTLYRFRPAERGRSDG